jgi:hypothetical protein
MYPNFYKIAIMNVRVDIRINDIARAHKYKSFINRRFVFDATSDDRGIKLKLSVKFLASLFQGDEWFTFSADKQNSMYTPRCIDYRQTVLLLATNLVILGQINNSDHSPGKKFSSRILDSKNHTQSDTCFDQRVRKFHSKCLKFCKAVYVLSATAEVSCKFNTITERDILFLNSTEPG